MKKTSQRHNFSVKQAHRSMYLTLPYSLKPLSGTQRPGQQQPYSEGTPRHDRCRLTIGPAAGFRSLLLRVPPDPCPAHPW